MPIHIEEDAGVDQFLDSCQREYQQLQSEIGEIDLLIQQTSSEVDRLAQRNTHATNRMRQVEANLDGLPRGDIREAYTAVLDVQQRLFTMRGQLEKLQSDRRNLARYMDAVGTVLEAVRYQGFQPRAADKEDGAQPLVVRIIEAQERERLRLSRQMHDGPAQSLTNLILQAEICERLFSVNPAEAQVELGNLKDSVAGTFQKVKGFILSLRPMMLDDLGLVPTLRRYVDSFVENSGAVVQLVVTGMERRLVPHKEVTVFRVIQELLNQAVEQGRASSVHINMDLGEDAVRVSVEDNGNGFEDVEALLSSESDRFGMATLRERVEMLAGDVQFETAPERGTKVMFELPLP
jgi:two-component system sensor histidine kinase DegS